MATPHIAGIYAIMKQANPDHTQATAQSAIMTTAYQDPFTFDVPDPFYMGSGHVDVGKVGKGSVFEPGLVYAADYMDYLGFICGVSPEKLGLFNSAITCNDLESRGIHTEASNLNYPSIGIASVTGTKTVVRTVTSVAKENGVRVYKAVVDAPEGYNITIKPDNIRLKKGDEATFEVVVTQNTDDVYYGYWRFGSLTWVDKKAKYEVRSPIAVRAEFFDSPSDIYTHGETGSTSFDVSFGYNGSYEAKAYGLTKEIKVKEGWTIYDRGFGTIGPIKITNTVLLFRTRVAQTAYQSGDVVNVQVIGPSSRQNSKPLLVESTEQFIDIVLPEEGEWTVYINHGDVSPDKNYYSPRNIAVDVSFWPISLSSTGVNGSLSVESPSPLSATIFPQHCMGRRS